MPELPEVETIVKQLKKHVLNKKIVSVNPVFKKMLSSNLKEMVGLKFCDCYRRGKSIILELTENKFLLVHLRMTGHFHFAKKDNTLNKKFTDFIVLKVSFDDGSMLTHNSIRKFGSVKLLNKKQLDQELSKLGPEPLKIGQAEFRAVLSKKERSNVKTALMDQSVLAGIGNIYAQEALYHAQISPLRKINTLSKMELKLLYQHLQRILRLAIKKHGTTVENYVHIEGSGGFQNELVVYGKTKCPQKHLLKKVNVGGRGTSYCPICQK